MKIIRDFKSPESVLVSVNAFSGISEQAGADGKCLYRSENMSGRLSPSLSVRPKRATIRNVSACDGLFSDGTLGWVENGTLYYGGNAVSGLYLTSGEKRVLRLGKYLFIFPDCVYLNTETTSEHGYVFSEKTGLSVSVSVCDGNGNTVSGYAVSETEPDDAESGDWLALLKNGSFVLERFDGYVWREVKSFIKLSADHIGASFRPGEVLEVSGLEAVTDERSITVSACDDGNIWFPGMAPGVTTLSGVALRRNIPLLDFVTVSGGRLWGCRGGYDRNGARVRRLYASAEGDPTNWNVDGGALVLDIDGEGAFTGICDYLGMPLVFTENAVTEVRFSGKRLISVTVRCDGLESGAEKSAQTVGGILYYKSRFAVCTYDGSFPKRISSSLGSGVRGGKNGSPAGKNNGRYYVCLSENGKDRLYVYDTVIKEWFSEDDPGFVSFAERNGVLYGMFDKAPGETDNVPADARGIMIIDTDNLPAGTENYCVGNGFPVYEENVAWYFETGNISGEMLTGKLPKRLMIKVKKDKGALLFAGLVYGDGENEVNGVVTGKSRSYAVRDGVCVPITIPVLSKKTDCIRLKMSGKGETEIIGYSLEYGKGSEKGLWN